jgi:hypothetical protein
MSKLVGSTTARARGRTPPAGSLTVCTVSGQGVNTGLDKVLTSAVITSDLEILQVRCLYLGVYRLNATNPFNIA